MADMAVGDNMESPSGWRGNEDEQGSKIPKSRSYHVAVRGWSQLDSLLAQASTPITSHVPAGSTEPTVKLRGLVCVPCACAPT